MSESENIPMNNSDLSGMVNPDQSQLQMIFKAK